MGSPPVSSSIKAIKALCRVRSFFPKGVARPRDDAPGPGEDLVLDFGHYGPQRGRLSTRLLPSPAWLRPLPGGRAPGGWEIPAGHGGTLTRMIPGVESRSAPTTRIRSYNLIIHKDLDAPKFRRRDGQGAESTSQWPKSSIRNARRVARGPRADGPRRKA